MASWAQEIIAKAWCLIDAVPRDQFVKEGVVMSNSLSQMQMLYVSEEDRILFRVNSTSGEEFRFWLTRRYVLLLIKVLKDFAD